VVGPSGNASPRTLAASEVLSVIADCANRLHVRQIFPKGITYERAGTLFLILLDLSAKSRVAPTTG
jgi:hypothetical protein